MASTNKTPNYNLSQFEPTDELQRVDWNSDMTKIDTAIKANATNIGLLRSLLWSGSLETGDTTVTLSDDIRSYRYLLVIGTTSQYAHYAQSLMLPVGSSGHSQFVDSSSVNSILYVKPDVGLVFRFPTATTLLSVGTNYSATARITAVYGIK